MTNDDWAVEEGVTCVSCPACAFTFDAFHTDADGTYSCPACAQLALSAALERLIADLETNSERGAPDYAWKALAALGAETRDRDAKP